ncbi:VCBS repeat-containing protein [Aliikangiella sp. G2MR2-5]|uniref:FG-GAP repeat domain-containing protein n=1 Tax=Aliikangiella sp. G2MR2-5 TaxID=2788943 RepID=UPI0018AC80EB|nr:VCBS repeat-containing protein [Aliikangiella sp. G2MR2-5]
MQFRQTVFCFILLLTSSGLQAIELSSRKTVEVGKSPNRVLAVDMDNDGQDEVIVSSHAEGTISLLTFSSSSTLLSKKIYEVGANPSELIVFDMNRDSYKDLIIANHETNSFHILYNDKEGAFEQTTISTFSVSSAPHIHTLGVGMFNKDDFPDVVVDSWANSQLLIYFGKGDGSFEPQPQVIDVHEQPRTNLVVTNIDGDNLSDIVTPAFRRDGVSVILGSQLNDAKRANKAKLFSNAAKAFLVKTADVNGDGNQDILTVHRGSSFRDSNGEGLTLLLGNGKGEFEMAEDFPLMVTGSPSFVAIGDINKDFIAELITANYRTNDMTVVFYEQTNRRYQQRSFPVGKRPESVAIGDIDGDGENEVIVANRESHSISLLDFTSLNLFSRRQISEHTTTKPLANIAR